MRGPQPPAQLPPAFLLTARSHAQGDDEGNFCLDLNAGGKITNLLSHLGYNLMQGCYLPFTVEETERLSGYTGSCVRGGQHSTAGPLLHVADLVPTVSI